MHRSSPTRWVFSRTGLELMTHQPPARYLDHWPPCTREDGSLVSPGLDKNCAGNEFVFLISNQGRSYRRINNTPSYKGPNACNCNSTTKSLISKKGLEGILIQGPLRTSYASVTNLPHILHISENILNRVLV
ncbi:hypothetical protein TNCV_1810261 [Trichonephila clavipes]|nr:hypothetical protein TNCV_1810261 [Trichonephila clavipes]